MTDAISRLGLTVLLSGIIAACGPIVGSHDDDPPEIDVKALAASDLAELQKIQSDQMEDSNQKRNTSFRSVFGGTDGISIHRYFTDRVRKVMDQREFRGLRADWEDDTAALAADLHSDRATVSRVQTIAAVNFGVLAWLEGIYKKKLFRISGSRDPVSSTRAGFIVLAQGYGGYVAASGKPMQVPIAVRQGILLHEARHSDCTGGLSKELVREFRSRTFADGLNLLEKSTTCGHLHAACPPEHKYNGKSVCDSKPWGAYSVGALFSEMSLKRTTDLRERAELKAQIVDQWGRVNLNIDDLMSGKFGRPDMTSSGVVR